MKTLSMSWHLTRARLASREGESLLDVFAIIAYGVSSWLTLTTLGGVWMFLGRRGTVDALMALKYGVDESWTTGFGEFYFGLAIVALALLAVPLMSVGAGAARLGANGRARRLASLRLIGVTGAQVTLMSVVETLLLATLGFIAGLALYLATLPLWSNVSFQSMNIDPGEMMLPWWGTLGAFLLVLVIAALSTVTGLLKVSISPLGVARREAPKALKSWRLVLLVVAVILMLVTTGNFSPFSANTTAWVSMAAVFLLVFGSMAIAGPWFIQVATRLVSRTGSPSKLLATRRVIDDPRAAWRNVSAVSLMGLIASLTTLSMQFSMTPTTSGSARDSASIGFNQMISTDIITGTLIAFAFALVLGAVSTLIQQSSDVFDRADESQSLVAIGTPLRVLSTARLRQIMGPLVLMLGISVGIGALPAAMGAIEPLGENVRTLSIMVALGIVMSLVAVTATVPIQKRVLAERGRKND